MLECDAFTLPSINVEIVRGSDIFTYKNVNDTLQRIYSNYVQYFSSLSRNVRNLMHVQFEKRRKSEHKIIITVFYVRVNLCAL